MSERLAEYFNSFSDFYQKTLLRRFVVGLVIGSLLWLSIFMFSNIFNFLQKDNVWWGTFLYDLPLVGAILAVLVSLQIWGLLPQPANNEDKLIITENRENMGNEDPNKEGTDSEEIELED